MRVAILSDMHVPGRAQGLPDAFAERVRKADRVVHAGDFGSTDALADVRELAADLTAVYGNADPADVDLPPVASVEVGDATIVTVHGIVNPVERAVSSSEGVVFDRGDWLDAVADTARARADADGTVVGVAGHTHEVEDEVHDGIRVLNPGSATGVGEGVDPTMMTAEVADGDLDVTVHEA